jgi:hypothetical protein
MRTDVDRVRSEHEVVHNELAAAVKKIGQRYLAPVPIKFG